MSGKTWRLGNLRRKRGNLTNSLEFGFRNLEEKRNLLSLGFAWFWFLSVFLSLKVVSNSSQNNQILPSIYLAKNMPVIITWMSWLWYRRYQAWVSGHSPLKWEIMQYDKSFWFVNSQIIYLNAINKGIFWKLNW